MKPDFSFVLKKSRSNAYHRQWAWASNQASSCEQMAAVKFSLHAATDRLHSSRTRNGFHLVSIIMREQQYHRSTRSFCTLASVTWGNILKISTIYVKCHTQTAPFTTMFTSASNLSTKKIPKRKRWKSSNTSFYFDNIVQTNIDVYKCFCFCSLLSLRNCLSDLNRKKMTMAAFHTWSYIQHAKLSNQSQIKVWKVLLRPSWRTTKLEAVEALSKQIMKHRQNGDYSVWQSNINWRVALLSVIVSEWGQLRWHYLI